ncbi:MAG TPA: 2-C-methyl-D-erythritol 4-phosphate cytidylyltransferase [Acidimicrobiia bacterium]|nr:2-C-methyl-D-erythritol 4-phosphate cytidylyltransferase [Acidimicrobiia bacterium]
MARVSVAGIVVAAGSGTRFGAAKQFAVLGGERLVDIAVGAAGRHCDEVVVVLPPDLVWDGAPVAAAVAGGAHRSDSVRAGLSAIATDSDIVVVHDAARPLASSRLFDAVIRAVRDGADGAVPGLPVTDTIKRVEGDRIVETVDRSALVAVQTPQAFRAAALRRAHAAGADATDDAALVESVGGAVVVVPGESTNLKITNERDLIVAASLLAEAR